MKNSAQAYIGATVGVIFMVAILYISLTIECPSDSLAFTTRVILAIAVAAFSMVVSGTLEIKQQGMISAGGSIGVFVLIYMINPASNLQSNKCKKLESLKIEGQVKVNGNIVPDLQLAITQGSESNSRLIKPSEYGHFSHSVIKELFAPGVYYFKFIKNGKPIQLLDTFLSTPTDYYLNFNLKVVEEPLTAIDSNSMPAPIVSATPTLASSVILLKKGSKIEADKKYYSANKAFYLFLSDQFGDLSIYNANDEVVNHFSTPNIHNVKLQEDGNFCFYDENDVFLWCAFTQDHGYQLKLDNNGVLFVEDKVKTVIWKSN